MYFFFYINFISLSFVLYCEKCIIEYNQQYTAYKAKGTHAMVYDSKTFYGSRENFVKKEFNLTCYGKSSKKTMGLDLKPFVF